MYNGASGPRTFDTISPMPGSLTLRSSVRLIGVGRYSSRSRASSLPTASLTRFEVCALWLMACSRSSGSAMSECTGISVKPTWLPRSPPFSSPRSVIGTIATIDESGSSPLSSR